MSRQDEIFSSCQRAYDNQTPYDNEPNLETSIPFERDDEKYLWCPHCEIEKPIDEFDEVKDFSWAIVECPDCEAEIWVTD